MWGVDPFFSTLDVGKNSTIERKWISNPTLFESEVSAFASATLTQVVSAFARQNLNGSEPTPGFITSTSSRLFIRGFSLRLSQGILFTVGLAFVLLATVLRPKTYLRDNPGPIAAVAVVLATSETLIERVFSGHFTSSDENTQQALLSTQWKLREAPGTARLDIRTESEARNLPTTAELEDHTGWRPIPFRALTKAGIVTAFLAVIVSLAVLQQQSEVHSGLRRESEMSSTLFQYSTSAIFILLSYMCSGIDGAVRSSTIYFSLKHHPLSKRPLLFDIKDRPSFRPLWNAKSSIFAIAISSLVLLIFPAVKIVAVGLFHPELAITNRTFEFTIDQSLMANLERTYTAYNHDLYYMAGHGYLASTSDTMVGRAAQHAQWSKTPGFGASKRDGILENLVFSNISAWPTALDQASKIGDEIHINVPAIAVRAQCDMLLPEDFRLIFHNDSSLNCPQGTIECSTTRCRDQRGDWGVKSLTLIQGILSLSGPPCEYEYTYQGIADLLDNGYGVLISDWSPWSAQVFNITPLPADASPILPGTFNNSLPSVREVFCASNFTLVDVEASFTQSTRPGLNGTVIKLPWRPSTFDKKSISYREAYHSIPNWFYPPVPVSDSPTKMPGRLFSNSLWPSVGQSGNIFEILATYAEYQMHNLTKLLDPEGLSEALEQMLIAYQTEMIVEMTYLMTNITETPNSTIARPGVLSMRRPRIRQDLRTTIAIESLLAAILCCIVWIFLRFSGPALLPKDPDSIVARLSLLAGSRLVQRLREEGLDSSQVKESEIFLEKAELGWWRTQSEDTARWRWGIDIGDDVVRRNWDDPPPQEDGAMSLQPSENGVSSTVIGEGDASQRDEEPALEDQGNQQDHEEHHRNSQPDTIEPEANWSLSVGPSLHRSSSALSEDLTSSRLYRPPSTHQSLVDPPSLEYPSYTPMQLSPLSLGIWFHSYFDDEDTGRRAVSPEEFDDRSTNRQQ